MHDMNRKLLGECNGAGCEWARKAAGQAVKQMFAILGVNLDDAKEVNLFRERLNFRNHMLVLFGVDIDDAKQVAEFQERMTVNRRIHRFRERVIFVSAGLLGGGVITALWQGIFTINIP